MENALEYETHKHNIWTKESTMLSFISYSFRRHLSLKSWSYFPTFFNETRELYNKLSFLVYLEKKVVKVVMFELQFELKS